ncbi:MAG: DNA adenine methylase [Desulfobulbus sp.]
MESLIPYFDGKSRLAKTIISRFPEHQCYVEVFAGAANVFFAKEPGRTEVINELDKDLVNLYRIVKYHPEELHRQFKYALVRRNEFSRLPLPLRKEFLLSEEIFRILYRIYVERASVRAYRKSPHGIPWNLPSCLLMEILQDILIILFINSSRKILFIFGISDARHPKES